MAGDQHLGNLLSEQNKRIDARKAEFLAATQSFAKCSGENPILAFLRALTFLGGKAKLQRKEALLNLYAKHRAYVSCVESCIGEGSVAGAFEHEDWVRDRCGSADDILTKMPKLQEHLRRRGAKLGCKDGAFEPSPNTFQMMQGLLATYRPERAKALKALLSAGRLPVAGFNHPLRPNKPLPEQEGREVHFHAPVTNPQINMSKTNQVNVSGGTGVIINVADFIQGVTNTVNANVSESGESDEIKKLVQELSSHVKAIGDQIDPSQLKKMGKNLKRLSEELASPEPERAWYEVSVKGLMEAAKAVGEVGAPMLATLAKLAPLLLV
jgi:hypothetical protein